MRIFQNEINFELRTFNYFTKLMKNHEFYLLTYIPITLPINNNKYLITSPVVITMA